MSTQIPEALPDFFKKFHDHLERYSRPSEEEKKQIKDAPKRIRRLDSLSRLMIKENTDNCVAVVLFEGKWQVAANESSEIEGNLKRIFSALRKVKVDEDGNITSTTETRKALNAYIVSAIKKPIIYKRLQRDVKKFLAALKSDKIFKTEEREILLRCELELYKNSGKKHAEIKLASKLVRLVDEEEMQKVPIGISKLCCKMCAAGMSAINKAHDNIHFRTKGRHGNFYYGWKPTKLLLNRKCLQHFVGKAAYEVYQNAESATRKRIRAQLKDLHKLKTSDELLTLFKPGRGAVNMNSASRSRSRSVTVDNQSTEISFSINLSDTSDEAASDSSSETEQN